MKMDNSITCDVNVQYTIALINVSAMQNHDSMQSKSIDVETEWPLYRLTLSQITINFPA